jgi:hypothetical protein
MSSHGNITARLMETKLGKVALMAVGFGGGTLFSVFIGCHSA